MTSKGGQFNENFTEWYFRCKQTGLRETALVHACHEGDLKQVEKLMAAGSNPLLPDSFKDTPLAIAVRLERADIVACLLERRPMEQLLYGNSPVFVAGDMTLAVAQRILSMLSVQQRMHVLNSRDNVCSRYTALHMASERLDVSLLGLYLQHGACPLSLTREKYTALAVMRRRYGSANSSNAAKLKAARRLLLAAQDDWINGWSPQRHQYLYAGFRRRAFALLCSLARVFPRHTKIFPKDVKFLLLGYLLANSYRSK